MLRSIFFSFDSFLSSLFAVFPPIRRAKNADIRPIFFSRFSSRFSPFVVLFHSKFLVLFDRTDSRSSFPLISPPIRSTSFLVFSRFVFELFPLSPRYPRNLIFLLFFVPPRSLLPLSNFISSPIPTEKKQTLNLAELNFPTMQGCDFFFHRVIPNELSIKKLGFRRVRFRCSLRNVLCLNRGR